MTITNTQSKLLFMAKSHQPQAGKYHHEGHANIGSNGKNEVTVSRDCQCDKHHFDKNGADGINFDPFQGRPAEAY